jgi:hypothetical protein
VGEQKIRNSGRRPADARPWRAATVAAALAATALLAAACGGGPRSPGSGSDQNVAAAVARFASCIRNHGVPGFYFTHQNVNPSAPPDGAVIDVGGGYTFVFASTLAFNAAAETCQHLAPFLRLTPPRETRHQFLQALMSAECMRSHGYPDWPDKTKHGWLVPVGIDTNSTQFQTAAKTCGLGKLGE